ncbi:MAG TPA: FtsX-like permease family protein, partial [Gaiellaceae bacterium]|nr:FtsX-like permease family protein [Gaiellaceae bacterium]
ALVRSPEYLLATANPDYLIPLPGSLAPIFLPRPALQALAGASGQVNDVVADFPAATPLARRLSLADGLPVATAIPRDAQYSLRFTNADIRSFSILTPVLAGVFAAVGLLLVALSLRRVVQAQRRELGALLALGYGRLRVIATVLGSAAMLGVGGALVALAMTLAVGFLVAEEYARTVGFPQVVHGLAAAPLALGAGLALGATLLAAALPAAGLARLRPTLAMRGEQMAAFSLPDRLERLTARGGPALAYALRALLRRPLWSGATVLSVAGAIALGAALQIVATSTNRSIDATFAHQRWSATADLAQPLPLTTAHALARAAGAQAAEPTVKGSARLLAPSGEAADIQLVGLPPAPALERLDVSAGTGPAQGAAALSEQVASQLHVRPGAHLTLVTPSGDLTVRVAGTVRTIAGGAVYLPRAQAAALLGLTGRATNVLVTGGWSVERALRSRPEVARVTSKSSARDGMHKLVRELTTLIDVLVAISLAVGGLFLVSSLTLSTHDREGELATLRALGFGRRQITIVLGGEAGIQTLLAAGLSIPLALALAAPLTDTIGRAWFRIGLSPGSGDFAVVIVLGLALGVLTTGIAVRNVLRLDLARTVRARLIG